MQVILYDLIIITNHSLNFNYYILLLKINKNNTVIKLRLVSRLHFPIASVITFN